MNAGPRPNLNPNVPRADRADADLWAALEAGEMGALAAIYDRYASLVYSIALKATQNTQDAEDLTQTIFLRLTGSGYDPRRGSLKTFLAILTRSRSMDWVRSRQRRERHWQAVHWPTATTDPPMEAIDQDQRARAVRDALGQLSENQQRVLHLAYREGLSQSAIAQRLEVPLGTVKAWARRGLVQLRRNLGARIGEES
ncbi:MAG: sigma-70 family RNA polymerase sigma factor [Cyanobacteria bacterium]|nr:sigma-70 family RNA polymerase sigma factor [Cyanobacteriota bacterium]